MSDRLAPVRACHYPFLHQNSNSLTAPTKMNLPTNGGRASAHSPEIGLTLVQLFCDKIMITLATAVVQQFYTYQLVRDNQAVLIISLKKLFNHFLDEIESKGQFFFSRLWWTD
jgi:hypothetical protein